MAKFLALFLLLALPAQAAPSLVEKYITLRHRAEATLQDFDRELDNQTSPGFLERSSAYRDLIAIRSLIEEVEEEFSLEPSINLESIHAADKVAVYDLLQSARLRGNTKLPELFSSNEEVLAHLAQYREEINARAQASRLSPELTQEIRGMIRDLALDNESLAASVKPSPGKDGNITGNTFPSNTWALTYDDGPHEKFTLPILANLKKYNKKATFFWLAQNLNPNLAVVEKVKAAGMALANHSYSHANLPKVSASVLNKEIVTSSQVEAQIYGYKPKFFRCPYGAGLNVSRVRQLIAQNGMIHVFWNVDSLDWQDKNPVSIFARVKKQMLAEKKGVILHHDIQPPTLEASRLLFEYSKSLGSKAPRWVTMPEIAKEL